METQTLTEINKEPYKRLKILFPWIVLLVMIGICLFGLCGIIKLFFRI
jgi:hypothetical protein